MSIFNVLKIYAQNLFDSTCTITEFQPNIGAVNNTSAVVVAENIPCRVMYKSIPRAVQSATGSALTQVIKLFLCPEVIVKAGSTVRINKNGIEAVYTCTGEPAVYISHQEIELKLKGRWA